ATKHQEREPANAVAAAAAAAGSTASSFIPSGIAVTAAPECSAAPGMVARVLLERVLALARLYAPEAEPRGVVERLWVGVQRISGTLCETPASTACLSSGALTPPGERGRRDVGGQAEGERGGMGGRREELEDRRRRSARRLSKKRNSRGVTPADEADLHRLLSAAVEAWCLPDEHGRCRIAASVLEGSGDGDEAAVGDDASRDRRRRRRLRRRRQEDDYEGLSSLISQITQEHVTRLPKGLKRVKLANNLRKAKYTPPPGSSSAKRWDDDDVLALAPWRVLLGIALGVAPAGTKMAGTAAEMLVKAASVRPRCENADRGGCCRDGSCWIVAPFVSLCTAARWARVCVVGGGHRLSRTVRATLHGVLADCMRAAVGLLEMVLAGANRLGQAVSRDRLERPRAVIGLAASCILLVLRHSGPLSEPPPPAATPERSAVGGGSTGHGEPGPLDAGRSAVAAAGAFVEVLGRALDPRISEYLGSAALTTVMSAVLHCWPPPPPACGDASGSAGPPRPSVPGTTPVAVETERRRGYAMGWWRLEPDGRLRSADDELEDEFGSMDFLFSPELDAMLGASAPSQPKEIWRCLAGGARTHILPHLNEMSRTYTAARYAQSSSSGAPYPRASRTAHSVPRHGAEGRGNTPAATPSSVSAAGGSSSSWADFSRVNAGTMLELHASAALLAGGSGSPPAVTTMPAPGTWESTG
ncbi:unnamed protein product, partial [Scytosiphon promiscuus]